jgi:hypothetical protein
MFLIRICLTRGDMGIRTYPYFRLRIKWFLLGEMSVYTGRTAGNPRYGAFGRGRQDPLGVGS